MSPQAPIQTMTDKAGLRRTLRAARKSVPESLRRRAGQALVRHALRHRLLVVGKRTGFYIPANSEIDVVPLLERAQAMGVQCFLPIVPGRGQLKMWFSKLGPASHRAHHHWRLNRFGIAEYHAPQGLKLRGIRLQQVFMPLLGFDRLGYRIGMGGGYYDASFAYLRRRRAWRSPRLIGVAFSAQEVGRIPKDPWDIPLDGMLTEKGLIRPKAKRG